MNHSSFSGKALPWLPGFVDISCPNFMSLALLAFPRPSATRDLHKPTVSLSDLLRTGRAWPRVQARRPRRGRATRATRPRGARTTRCWCTRRCCRTRSWARRSRTSRRQARRGGSSRPSPPRRTSSRYVRCHFHVLKHSIKEILIDFGSVNLDCICHGHGPWDCLFLRNPHSASYHSCSSSRATIAW